MKIASPLLRSAYVLRTLVGFALNALICASNSPIRCASRDCDGLDISVIQQRSMRLGVMFAPVGCNFRFGAYMFGVSKSAGAALAVRLMFILGTFVITTSASATPISFDHFSLVAVNPPRQFETEPIFKEPATGLDVPDFYRGMDETLLPDGYELRGQGVALFYTQNTLFASPDDLITFASPFAATSTLTTALEPGGQPIVNPEPSSLVLLGTGLLLVVKARTFRRRRS